jgi:hypothetical protein
MTDPAEQSSYVAFAKQWPNGSSTWDITITGVGSKFQAENVESDEDLLQAVSDYLTAHTDNDESTNPSVITLIHR